MYGRIQLAATMANGRLHASGEPELTIALGQWFKGISYGGEPQLYRNAGSTCSPKRRMDAMILSCDR
jgi:hypothetical protein